MYHQGKCAITFIEISHPDRHDQSEDLKDAFSDLDDGQAARCTLTMSPDAPHFRLACQSTAGSTQVDYPKDSDAFESFESLQTQSFSYKLALIQPALKVLNTQTALKTAVNINQRGLLQLKHLVKNENAQVSFVEIIICPDEEDVDETTTDGSGSGSAVSGGDGRGAMVVDG